MGASSLQQIINYSNAANFTFDSSLIEIVSNRAKLKKLTNDNETMFQNFASKDLYRAVAGSLTGNLVGTASVSSGYLNITNSIGSWNFNPAGMVGADGRIGTIRFKYRPLYSGSPANQQNIYVEQASNVSTNNQILIYHTTSGNVNITFRNSGGGGAGTLTAITGWSPTAGQTYEFELNFDTEAGTEVFYLDGIQQGSDLVATFARDETDIAFVQIGSTSVNSNFELDDLQRFDAKIHSANFVSEVPRVVSLTDYSIANPSIINNSGVLGDSLDNFEETVVAVTAPDALRYIINISSQDKYWDGSAWSNSDGTYAQSNTAAVIIANKDSLDLSLGGTIKIKSFLHSDDGSSTPEIETITINYNFYNVQSDPPTCTIWGFYRDVSGQPVEGATVTFKLKRADTQYREASSAIIEKKLTRTTDVNGRFEIDLIRSSAYEAGGEYILTIIKEDEGLNTSTNDSVEKTEIEFTVPDLADANITDQITAAA